MATEKREVPQVCSNCHKDSRRLCKGRCSTCYDYMRRNNGEERDPRAPGRAGPRLRLVVNEGATVAPDPQPPPVPDKRHGGWGASAGRKGGRPSTKDQTPKVINWRTTYLDPAGNEPLPVIPLGGRTWCPECGRKLKEGGGCPGIFCRNNRDKLPGVVH